MLYVVVKYVEADCVESALKKQARVKPHEIHLSSKWIEQEMPGAMMAKKSSKLGFNDKIGNCNSAS